MKSLVLAAFAICAASALHAQVAPGDTATATQAASAAALAERRVSDPTLRAPGRGTAPAISFQFSNDEKTATAQVGGGMGSARRWGLTVSGPLASGGRTTLATGEGLNSGFNAELVLRNVDFGTAMALPPERFQAICDAYMRPGIRATRTAAAARAAAEAAKDAGEPAAPPLPIDCGRADLTPEGQRILDAEAFPAVWAYGASFKVGRADFDFAVPVTFADSSETHDGWSASAHVGRFQSGPLSALLYYVGATYRHEVAYVPGSGERNICTPIGGSTSSFCRDIAVGAPRRQTSDLVQLEARSFIGSSVGLAPLVTFDTGESDWSVSLPVYLRNVEGPFNGGVSVGWDSRSHDIVLSLFVGALPRLLQ